MHRLNLQRHLQRDLPSDDGPVLAAHGAEWHRCPARCCLSAPGKMPSHLRHEGNEGRKWTNRGSWQLGCDILLRLSHAELLNQIMRSPVEAHLTSLSDGREEGQSSSLRRTDRQGGGGALMILSATAQVAASRHAECGAPTPLPHKFRGGGEGGSKHPAQFEISHH